VEACIAAVKAGKLNCLKYLHEHGCTRDAGTTYAAAVGGELDCLKFAHERGCAWIVAQLLTIRSRWVAQVPGVREGHDRR
jgi:hypothetical protein